ncbi:hypothetical protein LXL04_017648 [Taraxacum kok-saghyz]
MEDLPENVTVEILSRLPVKTIIHCKCVCKKWLNLVSNSYFATLHLSRSPAGLMIHHNPIKGRWSQQPGILKWVEVEDEYDDHHLHHDPVMSLNLNLAPLLQKSTILTVGSVNGLLCLWQSGQGKDNTYICNPITREYMILPRQKYYKEGYADIVYCFGVGSLRQEYRVIRIFQGNINIPSDSTSRSRSSVLRAEVYTFGTSQWRSVCDIPYWLDRFCGPFLNGHAHWSVFGKDSPENIYVFDFDNETFNFFPSPPVETIQGSENHFKTLAVLNGCLCQCDTFDSQLTIWVMKEYGVKTSWHKDLVIKESFSSKMGTRASD